MRSHSIFIQILTLLILLQGLEAGKRRHNAGRKDAGKAKTIPLDLDLEGVEWSAVEARRQSYVRNGRSKVLNAAGTAYIPVYRLKTKNS